MQNGKVVLIHPGYVVLNSSEQHPSDASVMFLVFVVHTSVRQQRKNKLEEKKKKMGNQI